ncbi:NADP-dependent oxidoreductase [Haloarcula litorea]|uniref:NADP-dependent oxidoreductase n=1 Tax=Haloarcula litorea TaxID=3032579 RepID=UPI0023E7ACE4|nr:NADP-dependent oxidoreductase [Halomicroarcula sp. GDY20]
MRAIRLQETDGIDALTEEDVSCPEPSPDEYLVRVHAAGINPLDWLLSRGMLPHLLDTDLPWIPGWDVSGVVESVGSDVSEFAPGDAVFGMSRLPGAGGAFADHTTMSADEIAAKPEGLSHHEAAAVPMAGQTAFHALYEEGDVDSAERVLVHAASGGVGHMAIQFAEHTGAHVIGTASGDNEAFLRELGVDEFVNYRSERFEEVVDDVDLVLDAVGGDVLERSVEVLRSGGIVVTLPEPPSQAAVDRYHDEYGVDVRFFDVITDSDPETLRQVAAHIDAGVVAPRVSDVYSLSKMQDALDRSAGGHVRGKLAVGLTGGVDD